MLIFYPLFCLQETSKIGIMYVNDWIGRDGEAFNKMENLKTLLIDGNYGRFEGSLKHLPNSLRVLDCRSPGFTVQPVFFNKASVTLYNLLY